MPRRIQILTDPMTAADRAAEQKREAWATLEKRIAELEEALELISDGGTTGRTQAPALNMPSEDWLRYRINDLERIAVKALRKL